MSIKFKNGVGYGDESGAMYIDMLATMESARNMMPARPVEEAVPMTKIGSRPWSFWGSNNLLPLEMVADIKSCLLYPIIDGRTRLANCDGVQPVITKIDATTGKKVIETYVDDDEINDFLENNNMFRTTFAWIKDYVGFLRCVSRIVLNKKKDKIAILKRDDVVQHRMNVMDAKGKIPYVWYSAEWARVSNEDDNKCFKKPLLNPDNPYLDLTQRMKKGSTDVEFSMVCSHPGWDEVYYPVPLWMSALKWVKIAASIPEMKAAMYENAIRAKMQVIIVDTYWEKTFGTKWSQGTEPQKEAIRKQVYDDVEKFLVGSKNAGKTIFSQGYMNREGEVVTDIIFKEIGDNTKQGEYLPDSAAANSEIAFSMLWNNALTGGNQKNGLYQENQGGSNVREASALQVIIHEVERQVVRSNLNVVKRFNGWSDRLPGLDFIIPATILTTLDTGAGSKPVTTGGVKPNENEKGNY